MFGANPIYAEIKTMVRDLNSMMIVHLLRIDNIVVFFPCRIGLCGFDNPHRDPKTDELKRHIGQVNYQLLILVLKCNCNQTYI